MMAFDQSTFAPVSSHAAPSPSVYSYITNDALSDILSLGYFDKKRNQLEKGDFIQVETPLGYILTQVTILTGTVQVGQNAIIKLDTLDAKTDFASPSWEGALGTFQFEEQGSVYRNAPFEILQQNQDYEVIVETQRGSFNIKQLMTVKDPEGITKQYYRAGSPPAVVVAGPWSVSVGGITQKNITTTTGVTPVVIDKYTTEDGKAYVIEFSVNAIRTDAIGTFSAVYFMLLLNDSGVSIVGGLETIVRKTDSPSLMVTVTPNVNDVDISVRGALAQDWKWFVNIITSEILE